jgi:uncharacterized protein YjbI with pentapeptide repeats
MANEEHLAILRQGVYAWNNWRMCNPEVIPDLSLAAFDNSNTIREKDFDLFEINFSKTNLAQAKFIEFDLAEADFSEANLDGADFSRSILSGAILNRASLQGVTFTGTKLNKAKLNYTNMVNSDLSKAKLVRASLCGSNLNYSILEGADLTEALLIGANLNHAKLINVNFSGANVNEANFVEAHLNSAEMHRVQALGANFSQARLTGVCIEDWNINNHTKLQGIDCSYIYLKSGNKDRCPNEGIFTEGEFSKRFQVSKNIIELTFYEDVPWKAFAYAFNESNVQILDEYGSEIFLREYKVLDDGLVTIKVSHPSNANSDRIKEILEQKTFEFELQIAQLQGEVKAKDSVLSMMFERLLSAPASQVNYQIQAANVQIGENSTMSGDRNINTGGGNYIESNTGNYVEGDYFAMGQDLASAAIQIQDLIDQLQKRGVTVDVAQEQVAKDMATQAQADPTVKDKLLKWGQSLGDATVSEVVKGAVKLAIRSTGIPLP